MCFRWVCNFFLSHGQYTRVDKKKLMQCAQLGSHIFYTYLSKKPFKNFSEENCEREIKSGHSFQKSSWQFLWVQFSSQSGDFALYAWEKWLSSYASSFVRTHIGQLVPARNNSFCAPLSTTRHKFIQNGDKKRNNKQGDAHWYDNNDQKLGIKKRICARSTMDSEHDTHKIVSERACIYLSHSFLCLEKRLQ